MITKKVKKKFGPTTTGNSSLVSSNWFGPFQLQLSINYFHDTYNYYIIYVHYGCNLSMKVKNYNDPDTLDEHFS